MAHKFMYILNDFTQNNPFILYVTINGLLDIQPNEPTNQDSIKVPKVVEPMNEKMLL